MQIIAGKYKRKVVPSKKSSNYRPITAKLREAIFSIISSLSFSGFQQISGAQILDLFAGTGILSFEALSRGAKAATLIDNNFQHLKQIQKFADKIGERNNVFCYLGDASYLKRASKQYNIVFIDPPYYNNLCTKTLANLQQNNYLENNSVIVIKMEKTANLSLDSFRNLHIVRKRFYGKSQLVIAVYKK